MILVMGNYGEAADYDFTVVGLDDALVRMIAVRGRQALRAHVEDPSLAELGYWEPSPRPARASADAEDAIEKALEDGDGWALIEDGALAGIECGESDCTLMRVTTGAGRVAVGWDYVLGSLPVQTINVPIRDLADKLGSPLGDPLCNMP